MRIKKLVRTSKQPSKTYARVSEPQLCMNSSIRSIKDFGEPCSWRQRTRFAMSGTVYQVQENKPNKAEYRPMD